MKALRLWQLNSTGLDKKVLMKPQHRITTAELVNSNVFFFRWRLALKASIVAQWKGMFAAVLDLLTTLLLPVGNFWWKINNQTNTKTCGCEKLVWLGILWRFCVIEISGKKTSVLSDKFGCNCRTGLHSYGLPYFGVFSSSALNFRRILPYKSEKTVKGWALLLPTVSRSNCMGVKWPRNNSE